MHVNHKPATSKTGMLSAAGKPTTLRLAPPPTGTGKIRSPLPPLPNDPASAKLTSSVKASSDDAIDPLSIFSQLEWNLPSVMGSGSLAKSSAAGWGLHFEG